MNLHKNTDIDFSQKSSYPHVYAFKWTTSTYFVIFVKKTRYHTKTREMFLEIRLVFIFYFTNFIYSIFFFFVYYII